MKKSTFRLSVICLLGLFLTGEACTQKPNDKGTSNNPVATPPLTMVETSDGKWAIMDDKKTTIYEVFIYDNGPDYPSEGLIRIVKNGKIGYADANTYVLVIAPQFDCAFPFENGKAKVSNRCKTIKEGEYNIWESDFWQYVDKEGSFSDLSK